MDKIRLLVCRNCGSIEELPYFEGRPQDDEWLNLKVKDHQTLSGEPHIGQLCTVARSDWSSQVYREEIVREIGKKFSLPGQGEGLGQSFYDLKSTYLEDAMSCWKGFGRTRDPGHCDYRRDSKRLVPDTKAERKAEGLDPKTRPNTFLCDFCPVQTIVDSKKRAKDGLYD